MKLFYQLNETDQNNVLHHCANMVVQDMIEDGVKLDPISEEEFALKDKLDTAINDIEKFQTKEEKINYLLGDAVISKAIYDIALEMAKSAFYHSSQELVIYPDDLKKEELIEHEEENLLPEINTRKSKVSPLN